MSGPLKRFVDSLRGLFSDPENDDPLDRMSDIEPEGVEDSTESEENTYPPVAGWEMEREAET
ncbi:hypothetical protein H8E65_04840 [Candidatus Bathyarchaeota archaeon]|nr:hypothetical protein [Candidatus Bathyarchaeota archaeon]MBL7079647.1 hypothetical protein [Candidatus Bathyarchaeota archaeon]